MGKIVPFLPVPPLPPPVVRQAKIDRYGELDRLAELRTPDELERKALKEEIESWHEDKPGDCAISEAGKSYVILMSARRKERTVTDKRKAFNLLKKRLGMDGLITALEIGLGFIDKHCTASEREAFVVTELSGYRTFSVVATSPAAAERKAA